MNADYVKEVRRFGSSAPFKDEDGRSVNLSHADNIDPALVRTDGIGNVDGVPLVWRKPCLFRPERCARALMGGKPWMDDDGEWRPGKTSCDTCRERSPGTFEACGAVVIERIESDPAIEAAFNDWFDSCGGSFGPRCFVGARMKLWDRFLQTIIDHGGWRSVNDDQVKLESLRLKEERSARRKANRKARARRQSAARLGTAKPITQDYLDKLHAERDRRSAQLKSLGALSGRTKRDMLWVKMLKDSGCDRIAEVWKTRELLARMALIPTGHAISETMVATGRWPLELPSLRARVYDDLKRLAKLEDDTAGAPLWPKWTYS
jgi:hypothetical protein